ncbi:LuxR family transcriptional regulator [Streptomyces sp. NRRL F-4489]|uniref:ATP-binding protein n=1 Tax=Streptomyces sp. NRRL F-4489 TaxID=1609095 RepID=UPI00074A2802|nr:AAA family ATPase [Streptomyces sp. NRRL F-4489]KUL49688.1 LuxR family transcriptional regulator [Streptomyces sp. NRRL F-4489]
MTAWADHGPLPGVVGRAAEHELVAGLLDRAAPVTLTGPAGVGKSLLARAVLEERRPGPDAVLRIPCWDGLTAAEPAGALRAAAGLPPETPLTALAAHCRARRLVILLDDCDPLLEPCAQLVRRLLRAEPALRIVATARRPLGLATERVVRLAPLAVTLGEGVAGPAVELLAARTGPAAPELLVAVCRALEGCPLAIGLAAHQLDRMPLAALAAHLDAEGPLHCTGPSRTARHTSLHAAHAAGYALCSPLDRRVWARLSVLPGDFDPWLAECVCASSDVPAAAVGAALERLRTASVLERVRDPAPGPGPELPPRYRLPRAARDFGRARLREAGDEAGALRRFRQACAALAAEAQITWQGAGQQLAVRLVEDEQHHLDAALTRPPLDADDAQSALEIAVSLWFQWAACGYRREGRAHLDRLLPRSPEDTAVRARALWLAGYLAAQENAPAAAEPLLDRAWASAVMHADADGLARIAHAHAVLALYREDATAAVTCLEEAVRHSSRDPWFGPGPAHSWALLAIALAPLDAARARAAARRAWDSRHSDGDFWLHSTILYARALIERAHGDPAAALRACRTALVAKKLIGDPLFIAGARTMLAGLRRGVRTGAPSAVPGAAETRWWHRPRSGGGHRGFFSRARMGR